tara:strand:- start:2651 stop:4255 length:1605 start_codon:yes stop_codon:yes gene_type:complete
MIKKYYATKDNTITNAFESSLTTRGTGSNMGASDILETFSIYGQVSSAAGGLTSELERILVQFPIDQVVADRSSGVLPASGSVSFYLNLYNAKHSETLPRDFYLSVRSLRQAWQEGSGLDMVSYNDLTYDQTGSNWIKSAGPTSWTTAGGYYWGNDDLSSSFSQYFNLGTEDLSIDISNVVEQWVNNANGVNPSGWVSNNPATWSKPNYGVLIRLSGSYESAPRSYYTKKFFSRTSQYFLNRPTLEARWDSSKQDDRGSFYLSSSLAPSADNLNTIYLYNYVRGRLTDIPSINTATHGIMVSLYSGSAANTEPSGEALRLSADGVYVNPYAGARPNWNQVVTGGWVSTGIYSASFAYTGSTTINTVYDVWFSGSDAIANSAAATLQFKTGSIAVKRFSSLMHTDTPTYVLSVNNRKTGYNYSQTHRVKLYVRQKNWSPNIYTTATTVPNSMVFESASYQIYRVADDRVIIPYNTGSDNATRLSYDVSGNYFDFDASYLEPNYTYGVKFSIYDTDTQTYEEQPYAYKFRVIKNEY